MAKRIQQRVSINGETRWISGSTQQELFDAYLEQAIRAGIVINPQQTTSSPITSPLFGDYLLQFVRVYKSKQEALTMRTRDMTIRKHILPRLVAVPISEIKTADVQRFMNSKAAMSRKSIREMVMVLGMILESAAEDGILLRNPARSKRLTNPSRKVATRNALTSVELNDIICQLPRLSREQERLFLRLLIYTGMRRNEVLGLRWDDVDLAEGIICVRRGVTYKSNMPQISTPKTAAGIRQIPIPAALRQWLTPGEKDCYVIGGQETPITEKSFQWMWRRIGESIDLHGATPHIFRHTYMTLAQRAQISTKTLQTIGGYADLATLQDRYVHTQKEDIEAARGGIDGMFSPVLCQEQIRANARKPL